MTSGESCDKLYSRVGEILAAARKHEHMWSCASLATATDSKYISPINSFVLEWGVLSYCNAYFCHEM